MKKTDLQSKYDSRYVVNRLSRAIGHVKLVKTMAESGADCTDLLSQLAVARGQVDSIHAHLLAQYAVQFAEDYQRSGEPEELEQFRQVMLQSAKK